MFCAQFFLGAQLKKNNHFLPFAEFKIIFSKVYSILPLGICLRYL